MSLIQNPIIPGFHPDPSICLVEDTFYLVTSSFEYFPGVPIFTSKDLIDWKLIGHCLNRNSQLPLERCQVSQGIYAPTIRYHNNTFFMVTTNVCGGGNFIVHTNDPCGEWSEPAWVKQGGIDPSLLFYENKVYFTSTEDCHGNQGIYLCEVDPFSGEMLTESILISKGCGGKFPEAPHLYYINDYFYLMLAEGGTEYGHKVTIQRSKHPHGPYEPCPHNPILSNVDLQDAQTACTGHADIIQDSNGSWWMVALGVRPLSTPNNRLMLHNLGRETYLTPVLWEKDWPIVENHGTLAMEIEADLPIQKITPPDIKQKIQVNQMALLDTVKSKVLFEDFTKKQWNLEFSHIRNPIEENYTLDQKRQCLILQGACSLSTPFGQPSFLGVRQNAFHQETSILIRDLKIDHEGMAGLSVYYNDEHHYDLGITYIDGVRMLQLRKQIYDLIAVTVQIPILNQPLRLHVIADSEYYTFYYSINDEDKIYIGKGTTAAMCTEITRQMTFTGTFFGAFAEGKGVTARFEDFKRMTLS